jgi:glycerate 2-kinase
LKSYRDTSPSLRLALGSVKHAIRAVDPTRLIKSSLKLRNGRLSVHDIKHQRINIDLKSFDHIYLIGAGKATAGMAHELRQIIGDKISGGAITVPYGTNENVKDIFITHASHPIPDVSGVKGTKKMIEILRKTTPADLVIVLISGGGSSLMPLPSKNLSLGKKQAITSSLILSGASIEEVNAVRKHLSRIKGGQLVRYMNKECRVVSLIISDVINDELSVIASGPTCPDPSTYSDAARVLKKYGLWNKQYGEAKNVIVKGLRGCEAETPKPGDPIFQRVINLLIGNNSIACTAAQQYLRRRRVEAHTLGTTFDGEAWRFGEELAMLAKELIMKDRPLAFVLGGETVVKIDRVNNYGVGGRNQEAVLAAAINLLQDFHTDQDITVLSAGTDGIDGNSEAAGAFLNSQVISNIQQKNLDARYFLKTHNSYCFFRKLNSLIITGRTGTNVNDISVICKIK